MNVLSRWQPDHQTREALFASATPEERKEYDLFGPWLLEVSAESEMPPFFRRWYGEFSSVPILLKFPIEEERRDVCPGMSLYRAILAVDEKGLTFLNRVGDDVLRERYEFSDIVGMRNETILLLGELTFYSRDGGAHTISYNAVSRDTMEAVVDFVRERFPRNDSDPTLVMEPSPVEKFPYGSILRNHTARDARFIPIYSEAPKTKWRFRRRPIRDLGNLVLDNGVEVVLITRGISEKKTHDDTAYGFSCLYLPYQGMKEVSCERMPLRGPASFGRLHLRTDGHDFSVDMRGDISRLTLALDRRLRG